MKKPASAVGAGGCDIQARGIHYHIAAVSSRPHPPLKVWSRPDDQVHVHDDHHPGHGHGHDDLSGTTTARQRQVLRNVTCRARPGELLAIVGPSGAGKSTLLEILAGRLSPSPPFPPDLLLLDGAAARSADLRRVSGYVTQRDVLFPLLTVRETLLFSARLRLGARGLLAARVDALLDDLTLRRVASTRIKDLSGGERRRVSIGVEAVHDPPVLILDSASALQIVGALRAMAETRGRTVLLSIHQPGARIVKMFDSVLLLLAAGSVDQLRSLLADAGLHLPPHVDPVEFSIDSVDALRVQSTTAAAASPAPAVLPRLEGGRCTLQQLFQLHSNSKQVADEETRAAATPTRGRAARGGRAVAALLQERGADAAALRVPHRLHAGSGSGAGAGLHLLRPRRGQGGGARGALRLPPHLPAVIHHGGPAHLPAGARDPGQRDVVGGVPRVVLRRGERGGVPALPAGAGRGLRRARVLADGAPAHCTGVRLLPAGPVHGELGGGVLRRGERGDPGGDGLLLPLLGLLHHAVGHAGVPGVHALPVAVQVAVRGAAGERVRRWREVRGAGAGPVRGHRRRGAAARGAWGGVQVAQRRRHGGLQGAGLRRAEGQVQPRAQQGGHGRRTTRPLPQSPPAAERPAGHHRRRRVGVALGILHVTSLPANEASGHHPRNIQRARLI